MEEKTNYEEKLTYEDKKNYILQDSHVMSSIHLSCETMVIIELLIKAGFITEEKFIERTKQYKEKMIDDKIKMLTEDELSTIYTAKLMSEMFGGIFSKDKGETNG